MSERLTKEKVWETFNTDDVGNEEDLKLFKKFDVLSAKNWLKEELRENQFHPELTDDQYQQLKERLDEAFDIGNKE